MEACPTCNQKFETKRGMRIHHKATHGESLAKTELECERCGTTYEEFNIRADRSRFCSEQCRQDWQSDEWEGAGSPRSKEHPVLNCEYCGEEYKVVPAREDESRFCSSECLDEWRSDNRSGKDSHAWEGGEVELQCEECSSSFSVKPARADSARFCSRDCKDTWQKRNYTGENNPSWSGGPEEIECEYCGDTYQVKTAEVSTSRFCSTQCHARWQSDNWRGEDAPAWKGGRHRYYGASWQKQRQRAIKRDGEECIICGDVEIHVHHIVPFRKFGIENHEEANELSNLVCLCQEHHAKWEGIPLRPEVD
jgi:5-methylcytosine-specific restriction endonuclease McrA